MAASTNWMPASAVTLSINGVPRPATDCEYSEDAGEFETTNLLSPTNADGLIHYEFGNDVLTTQLRGTIVVDKAAVSNFAVGKAMPASFSVAGEQAASGTIRFTNRTKKGAPKGGFQTTFTGKWTGAVTLG